MHNSTQNNDGAVVKLWPKKIVYKAPNNRKLFANMLSMQYGQSALATPIDVCMTSFQ